jgi:hypothetical protein
MWLFFSGCLFFRGILFSEVSVFQELGSFQKGVLFFRKFPVKYFGSQEEGLGLILGDLKLDFLGD